MKKTTLLFLILLISVQVAFARINFDEFVDSFAQDPTVLTMEEHSGIFTTAELRILRNTLYAKQGHIFKSSDLNKYFSSRTWYVPKSTSTQLTESDESIDNLIQQLEQIEEQNFSEFLSMFQETELPIKISNEKYGEQSSHNLPWELSQKYLQTPPCCKYKSITKFALSENIEAVIYKTIFNEEQYVLATLKLDGSLISRKGLSDYWRYMGIGSVHEASTTIINKDKSIVITDTGYETEGDFDKGNKVPFYKTKKLQIDRHGVISEL